jgi:glycosyltransferase involved in cell wall biosynthesis
MTKETVSLVMANFNHAHFLLESLPRIFGQTRPFDQVIVVDDCSTDNSLEVLHRFQASYPSLLVIQNQKNSGVVYSGNLGLAQATGTLIAMSAADDRLENTFVEKLAGMLEQYPHAGIATGYFTTFMSSTGQVSEGRMDWCLEPAYLSPEYLMAKEIGGNIPGHASMYRKRAIEEAGGILTELRWHCDWFMNHVIAARTGICFVPESIAYLRINDTSSYASGRSDWELQRQVVLTLLKLLFEGNYRDVKNFFQGAKILSTLSEDVIRLILEFPAWMNAQITAQTILMLRKHEREALLRSVHHRGQELDALKQLCEATINMR